MALTQATKEMENKLPNAKTQYQHCSLLLVIHLLMPPMIEAIMVTYLLTMEYK